MTKLQLTKAIALARLYDRSRIVRSTKNSDRDQYMVPEETRDRRYTYEPCECGDVWCAGCAEDGSR